MSNPSCDTDGMDYLGYTRVSRIFRDNFHTVDVDRLELCDDRICLVVVPTNISYLCIFTYYVLNLIFMFHYYAGFDKYSPEGYTLWTRA